MKTLAEVGERAMIQRLARRLSGRAPGLIVGIGDDCAVVRPGPGARFDMLLTSDPVIEGVHFPKGTPAAAVGRKAAGRVLSDIAAMGGAPLWALVDVVAPSRTAIRVIEDAVAAMAALGRRYGMAIVGGDVSEGRALEFHVFGVGRVPRGTAILRSGAAPGDIVCVTGSLGGSRSGKHLRFEPRVREGQWLRAGRWPTAMIDLSDGLASDLCRVLELSGTGVRLDLDRIPVSPAARRAAGQRSPVDRALCDGEDYELLFTIPTARCDAFERAWRARFRLRCTVIGLITDRRGRLECVQGGRSRLLRRGGYEHFRRE
jgi:thiamine-monophosphate kinase